MSKPLPGERVRARVTPGQSSRATGMAAVWLPWLAAPLFMAAPIGGCAVAGRWRPAVACAEVDREPDAAVRPVAGPAGAVVTVERR